MRLTVKEFLAITKALSDENCVRAMMAVDDEVKSTGRVMSAGDIKKTLSQE